MPGVAEGVVAVAFPEAKLIVVEKCEAANPLDGFPGIKMGDDEAAGAAVLGGERLAIVIESEQDVGMEQIGEWNVGGVTFFGQNDTKVRKERCSSIFPAITFGTSSSILR